MNRFLSLVTLTLCLAWGVMGGETAPERLGAHWARVSDRAQVELIADEVLAVVEGRLDRSIVEKHTGGGVTLSKMMTSSEASVTASFGVAEIVLEGTNASVVFPDGGTLALQKGNDRWTITGGRLFALRSQGKATVDVGVGSGASVGETFIGTPVSRDHGIDRLSRTVTREKLDRSLFGVPEKTASYYAARYTETAPYVSATYIQFVTDPAWNRLVYGNLNRWIKAYEDVQGPSAIAVDATGRVFVGESGRNRVSVLKISGTGSDASLQRGFLINDINDPTDIALSDNGTPLNTDDDLLYVADASANKVFRYSLTAGSAVRSATFEGFDSPTTVLVGKWNGANTNLIYVIDKMAKRVRLFEDRGAELSLLREMKGRFDQYFSSAKVDHFGQLYLVDNVNSVVSKYTPSLDLLDAEGGSTVFASLAHIDIPFGRIDIEGQKTRWVGFDQLFALERWGENSGAQRRTLGLALKNLLFRSDDDLSAIHNEFTLTDAGDIRVDVYDGGNTRIRRVHSGWMVSGGKTIQWDRRDDSGRLVPPGEYRYEIEARSAYSEIPLTSQTRFTLPMYYWENSGSDNRAEDVHLVQGSVVRWGSSPSETANEDASSVQYRFRGLNPASEYTIAAEYVAHDGARRLQDLTVNGARMHEPVSVTEATYRTGDIALPKEAYAGGEILVSINKREEGTAIVSQLWIRETGTGFVAQSVNESVPSRYALAQNYPNPFNPSTVIRYSLPADGNVSLKVYDIAGREIATLVNDFRRAGTYEARFDAGSVSGRVLASGVYFYRVVTGDFTETKKMVLLK
jgi:hypothetical protein